jgi:hypothetical protein
VSINDDANHYAYMLIHTVSFTSCPTIEMNIRNQCLDFKLMDGRRFSSGANWNDYPDEEVDTGGMMRADLIPFLSAFEGVLTYELEIRRVSFGNQRGPRYIRFFVAWKSEGYKDIRACVHLIEYDKQVRWDEMKLEECYQKCTN